jgi:hypothetical protein
MRVTCAGTACARGSPNASRCSRSWLAHGSGIAMATPMVDTSVTLALIRSPSTGWKKSHPGVDSGQRLAGNRAGLLRSLGEYGVKLGPVVEKL